MPRFHQVCSSIYVSDIIRPSYDGVTSGFPVGTFTFYIAITSFYNTGRRVCDLSKSRSSQAIERFLQTIYVSHYLTLEEEFQSRMQAALSNFIASAPTILNDLFQLIQAAAKGNQLLSGGFSNAKIQYDALSTNAEDRINILWINPIDELCNCGMSMHSCSLLYDQYCNFTYNSEDDYYCTQSIPGLYISCYVMDSFLPSTSECIYDAQCMMRRYSHFCETRTERRC